MNSECRLGAIAEEYLGTARAAARFFDGAVLREAVSAIADTLPGGPLLLLSTSEAGAGIAAACAYARDEETSWRRVDLTSASVPTSDCACVFIEAIEPDEAWRAAVARRYPGAVIVSAEGSQRSTVLAA